MPENFTQVDYQNLAAIVSLAKCEGMQQACALVVLHHKLLQAAEEMGKRMSLASDEVAAPPKE